MFEKTKAELTEADSGAEVCRYRRRREKDILRDIGFGPQFYYLRPFFVLMFGLFWSMPLSWIAVWMGARPPLLLDPFWGPVLVTWFSVGSGLMAMWAYVWPRRVHLAIHEKGFVYRGLLRRYAVRFDDVAQCTVSPNSRRLTLVLASSRRLWLQNFMIQFPEEGAVKLLERLDAHVRYGELQVASVDRDLATRSRARAGWRDCSFMPLWLSLPSAMPAAAGSW